jgi:CubicO group peptidase (beta-lactamase class C family)
MRRRTFLAASGRAALGVAFLPVMACSRTGQRSAESPARTTTSEALIADLEKQLPQLMADAFVPGVSIALVRDAQVVWRRGFGVADKASKNPVDSDTVFAAQSMSKPVFAYVVLKLCEKGILDLETRLTNYAPHRVLAGDARLDPITARHLLFHTGGFQNWRSEAEPLKINFTPGERWLYSGEGYSYLQSVVTHLTGHVNTNACATYEGDLRVCATNIDEYMKANLHVPFGMSSSGYVWNATFEARAARPHDSKGTPIPKRMNPTATDAARYASSGSLLSTSTDYAKFLIEVINPKKSDPFHLTRETLDEMVRPMVKVPDDPRSSSWALGWQVFDSDAGAVIAHRGNGRGFHAFAAASVAKKSAFVVMTNGDLGWQLIDKLTSGEAMNRLFG